RMLPLPQGVGFKSPSRTRCLPNGAYCHAVVAIFLQSSYKLVEADKFFHSRALNILTSNGTFDAQKPCGIGFRSECSVDGIRCAAHSEPAQRCALISRSLLLFSRARCAGDALVERKTFRHQLILAFTK